MKEYADVESATEGYARRFSGSVGEWLLTRQKEIVLKLLPEVATLVDVGGGHGQLAKPLAAAGWQVTVVGSHPSCEERLAAEIAKKQMSFVVADLLTLPWPDRSFDYALSFRLLPHLPDWPALIAELCRVAKKGVIVDYPTSRSANCLTDLLFGLKKRIEGNTREYTTFSRGEIRAEFAKNGFVLKREVPQYFFPMVLHRWLKTVWLSKTLERLARWCGLTALFGSPVIAAFERTKIL